VTAYYLAVDNRRPCVDVPRIVGSLLETVRPIVAAPGENLDAIIGEMDLDAVAVELYLMDPALAARHFVD
jgi:hypothetical protein